MITDMSVAPEIARLAETALIVPARESRPAPRAAATPLTLGTLARELRYSRAPRNAGGDWSASTRIVR